MATTTAREELRQQLRVKELLAESAAKLRAEAEAARLDLPGGERVAGAQQLEAARGRLREQGVDPDECTPDQLAEALSAVGAFPDDLATVPAAPAEEELEPVIDADIVREAKRLLQARGLKLNQDNFALALDVIGSRSR
jgi:hypothetical protein